MPLWIAVAVATVVWPVGLGAALLDRTAPPVSIGSSLIYLAAARVCHQRPDRSFHTAGYQWPVCARCAGLYAGAPVGVLLALRRRRARRATRGTLVGLLGVAAMPTALTWAAEAVAGLPISGAVRALAGVPLGLAVTMAVLWMLRPDGNSIK